jgi:hypothetical protein
MTCATVEARPVQQVRAAFAQSVDVTRPHTLLTEDCRHSGSLLYRYDDTAELVTVPNVPYNQPAAERVQYIRWQADGVHDQAQRLRTNPPYGVSEAVARRMVQSRLERAERMRREAARVERADRPGYPVEASRLDVDFGSNVE